MTTGRRETSQYRKRLRRSILVVGIGGAGGNIAADWQSIGALDGLGLAVQWLQVDTGSSQHRLSMVAVSLACKSTGGDTGIGLALAKMHRYLLAPLLAQADIVILVAGLGGGTGSGMTPYIARLARGGGAVTIAVVTLPFGFEGRRRRAAASIAIKRLRSRAQFVLTFSNQELAAEMGDEALLAEIYAVQSQRIGVCLRDLLLTLRRKIPSGSHGPEGHC
jgi:cell division protein FtsZ